MKRSCLNCGYGTIIKTHGQCVRCWMEPGVCDHAFVIGVEEAEFYKCENHMTEEEKKAYEKEKARNEYLSHLQSIHRILKKYPEFINLELK